VYKVFEDNDEARFQCVWQEGLMSVSVLCQDLFFSTELYALYGNPAYLIFPAFLLHFRTLVEIEPREPVNKINVKVFIDVAA
jgi:hypothetical protein